MREPLKYGTIVQNKRAGLIGMVIEDHPAGPEFPTHWDQRIIILPPLSDGYFGGRWVVGEIETVAWVNDTDDYDGVLNDDV